MSKKPLPSSSRNSGFSFTFRKFAVSGFIILAFLAYALHEHFAPSSAAADVPPGGSDDAQVFVAPTVTPPNLAGTSRPQAQPTRTQAAPRQPTTVPTLPLSGAASSAPNPTRARATAVPPTAVPPTDVPPTDVPPPTDAPVANGQYKDGTYTGDQIDVFYGIVQVQATVKGGKIADVRFLEYPQDRRTSQRINSYAVPYLQQEAMQTQSANVDMISGATLTSEGFIQSLAGALASAKN